MRSNVRDQARVFLFEIRISRDCFFPDPKDSCKAATGSQVIITLLYELSQVLSRLKSARATKHRIIKRASSLPWPDNERMEHVCRSSVYVHGQARQRFRYVRFVALDHVPSNFRVNFDRFSPICVYIYIAASNRMMQSTLSVNKRVGIVGWTMHRSKGVSRGYRFATTWRSEGRRHEDRSGL